MSSPLVRHTAAYLLARGAPAVVNLATLAYLTHALDPARYGSYAVIVASAMAVTQLGYYAVLAGVRRYLPTHAADPAPFLRMVLEVTAIFLTTVAAIGGGLVLLVGSLDPLVIGAVWALSAAQVWFELHLELEMVGLRPRRYGLLSGARAVLTLLFVWWTTTRGGGPYGVVVALVAGYLLPTVPLLGRTWRPLRGVPADRASARTLLDYGWPLAATFGLQYVVNFSDRLLLASLAGVAAAGVYSASYDLTQQTVLVVMMVVNTAAFPLVSAALAREGEAGARRQLRVHVEVLLALGLPATAAFALLAPDIGRAFLGVEFRAAGTGLAPIVALAVFLAGLKAYYFDLAFQFGQRTRRQLWITAASALLVTVLNLWWIPRFGASGAAWATVLAFLLALGLSAWWGRTSFALPLPMRQIGKVVLATAVMTLVLLPLRDRGGPWMLLGQVAAGILVYGVTAYLLDIGALRHRGGRG